MALDRRIFSIVDTPANKMQSQQKQLQRGLAALEANDYQMAMTLLLPLAEAGNAQAQANVGFLYSDSLYRFPHPDDAQGWESISPEEMKRWEEVDTSEAIKWLTKASERGIGPASHNLAMLIWSHSDRLSEEEAKSKAKLLLQRAWEQGCRVFAFSEADAQEYLSSKPERSAV